MEPLRRLKNLISGFERYFYVFRNSPGEFLEELREIHIFEIKGMIADGADMFNFEIDEEISEVFWDTPHKQVGADDENDGVAAPSKRGAKKIPEMWTRVFSVYGGDLGNVQAYPTATDLIMA